MVRSLPYSEALLLAVYFEEVGRIRRKQANDANGGHSTSGSGWHDDLVVDAEDDEEDEA